MGYVYPEQPASLVLRRWREVGGPGALPDADGLEELLSVCYQASLMREEERPVVFRAVLGGPRSFPPGEGPPSGLLRLRLDALRRARVEAALARGGVRPLPDRRRGGRGGGTSLRIWGSVHSGTRWIRRTQGGREEAPPLPPVPVVRALKAAIRIAEDIAELNAQDK